MSSVKTNEQIATAIQFGENDLIPVLYGRVERLIHWLCSKYYNRYSPRFAACGVELSDYKQECYFAFINAVHDFNEDKGFCFTSYLEYHIKNIGRSLLGMRSTKVNKRPLDNRISLDMLTEENTPHYEFIPDKSAERSFERAINSIADEHTKKVLYKALESLDKPLCDVIVMHYFEDKPLKDIAQIESTSIEIIRSRKKKALARLRKNKNVRALWQEK